MKKFKIGFCGLGKLGLPCAVAMDYKGHDVMGYDINPDNMNKNPKPYQEIGLNGKAHYNEDLVNSDLKFGTMEEVAEHAELIFIAVQTPHLEKYEGITRLPDERVDFNYDYLVSAVESLSEVVKRDTVVVIISTVLPGTFRKRILPVTNEHMKMCYNPYFIAMGTTIDDFLDPEFTLFGVHDDSASDKAEEFYKTIYDKPFYKTNVENAELIKVIYNTFISTKIEFANTVMEICHKTEGCDADEVMNALFLADKRIISEAYLRGGMPDGGGCHPRDNIALSWLSRELGLSTDWFEFIMLAREKRLDWMADIMEEQDLPMAIFGYTFKAETNLVLGSPAILLENILKERGHKVYKYDPYMEDVMIIPDKPHVILIGSKHKLFKHFTYPSGSVVIDPWRYVDEKQDDVSYIHLGANE